MPLSTSTRAQWSLALMLMTAMGEAARGQTQVPVGNEFQVNLYTVSFQAKPAIDADADGDFVVVWVSDGQGGNGDDIFGRCFTSSGMAQGGEFLISSSTSSSQRNDPDVALESDGDFVVVWREDENRIVCRFFGPCGIFKSNQFPITPLSGGSDGPPAVAAVDSGDFVVVWQEDSDIFFRQFDPDLGLTDPARVNTYLDGEQARPDVSADAEGNFAVVWQSNYEDEQRYDIHARLFASSGGGLPSEFRVNTLELFSNEDPSVAVDADFDFVVTWTAYEAPPPPVPFSARGIPDPPAPIGVLARRFGLPIGSPQAGEFLVTTFGAHRDPAVAIDNGGFVIAWDASIGANARDVFARSFAASGTPRGPELRVNLTTAADQQLAAVALAPGGDFVVAWTSPQDGSQTGIFAQRLSSRSDLDVDGNGTTGPLTDGLLTFRYHFGFTGNALLDGAVGAGCTRCTAEAILQFLQSQE